MGLFGNRAKNKEVQRVHYVRIRNKQLTNGIISDGRFPAVVAKPKNGIITIVLENSWFFRNDVKFDFAGAMLEMDDGSFTPLNQYRFSIDADKRSGLLFIRVKP